MRVAPVRHPLLSTRTPTRTLERILCMRIRMPTHACTATHTHTHTHLYPVVHD